MAVGINDITGDAIKSRPASQAYSANYDSIFRKPKADLDGADVTSDKPVESTTSNNKENK